MGLGAHVDGIVYSAEIGHRKPSPDFYRIAADRADAVASQIVLIDDTLPNVEAARQCGWRAVHWTGENGLHEALAPYLGAD
jgi:putative hydrolase of the HAD superfamily